MYRISICRKKGGLRKFENVLDSLNVFEGSAEIRVYIVARRLPAPD